LRTVFGDLSAGLNGLLVAPLIIALFGSVAMLTPSLGAQTTVQVASAPKSVTNAAYLADPATWQQGSVIIDIAPEALLQETPGGAVNFASTDRCYIVSSPTVTLPAGFSTGVGMTSTEIYNNIIDQTASIFLAAVLGPRMTDSAVVGFDCHILTFAYKQKAK